jgi:FAD dependent oxidoreductase TIGR03364
MKRAIVVGAGIVGLAMARALAARGFSVTVLERNEKAVGASVRNFGMVWPIGQPAGHLLERAMRSRSIWKELCDAAGIWYEEAGSLLAVRHKDEWEVMEEFVEKNKKFRHCEVLSPEQALQKSPALKKDGLLGALWSNSELIVDPREAIALLPSVLNKKWGVVFYFNTGVSHIEYPKVVAGKKVFEADLVFVCSGQEFEILYPECYAQYPITKCKLQMLRTTPQPHGWRMGAALCAGLTLIHYAAFKECTALNEVKKRFEKEMAEYLQWGIHVMASQQGTGEITLGDSHEYGLVFDPFDKEYVNQLILNYLDTYVCFPSRLIAQTWNGIYAKMQDGSTELVVSPHPGVTIVNGLGGAGMTLSFGLAEEVAAKV